MLLLPHSTVATTRPPTMRCPFHDVAAPPENRRRPVRRCFTFVSPDPTAMSVDEGRLDDNIKFALCMFVALAVLGLFVLAIHP